MIDDDDDFRTALASNLRDDGHEVIEAPSTRALPSPPRTRHLGGLIISEQTEQALPFCDRFHRDQPKAPVVLVIAYPTELLDRAAATRDFLSVVCKPLDYDELQALLAAPRATH